MAWVLAGAQRSCTPPEVIALVAALSAVHEVPGLLLDDDGKCPGDAELHSERDAIAIAMGQVTRRRLAHV